MQRGRRTDPHIRAIDPSRVQAELAQPCRLFTATLLGHQSGELLGGKLVADSDPGA